MFPIFSGFYIPKITTIGSFLTELLKIKMSSLLFETRSRSHSTEANNAMSILI